MEKHSVNIDGSEHFDMWKHHELTSKEKELMNSYESLDYDDVDNLLSKRKFASQTKKDKKRIDFSRWLVMFATGACTGFLAFAINISVNALSKWRFGVTLGMINNSIFLAYAIYTITGMIFVLIAAILVALIEPVSGGSGIPELKAYLNGCNLLKYLRLKTLICKVIGVAFSVSAGLAIGKEGPLVHTGSIMAANFSHLPKCNIKTFRNDTDKRNFVSGGAAAGVASAFGAPAGGVLFSFEEASTYWSVNLTWQVFFCAMVSTFTLNIFLSWWAGDFLSVNSPGLITFGRFIMDAYKLYELVPFAFLALLGGFIGAAFNEINKRICLWRRDTLVLKNRRGMRIFEALCIAFLTATISFWIPSFFSDDCELIPSHVYDRDLYKQYTCPDGFYNPMANVLFTTQEGAIKAFFHTEVFYSVKVLLVHFVSWIFLAVITYGIAVPSGLFVPCILAGCSIGRILGEYMAFWYPDGKIDPGIYAVMGAVAVLGGVTRMTISLAVILLESTNDIQYLLPIMLILMISKWVGDLFNISLYDMHVELKCTPFVETSPPPALELLEASNIMSCPPVCFKEIEKVGNVYDSLISYSHNGFPVTSVSKQEFGGYHGVILRRQLTILLRRKVFVENSAIDDMPSDITNPLVDINNYESGAMLVDKDFTTSLSSLIPDIKKVYLTHYERQLHLDLRPYVNCGAFSVKVNTPMPRIFKLFRSMGLRHLPVLDFNNRVVGMITRKELRTDFKNDLR